MVRKTDGEKIDELVTLVATLTERVNALHRVVEPMQELITRVAVVEQQSSDFQNRIAKAADRGWSLVPTVIGAILGGAIALTGQIIIKHFWP